MFPFIKSLYCLLQKENKGCCAFNFGRKPVARLHTSRSSHHSCVDSALLLPQRVCVLSQVYGGWCSSHFAPSWAKTWTWTWSRTWSWTWSWTWTTNDDPASGSTVSRVDIHSAGDGLEGAVPKVVESLLVQVVLLLTQALLEQLPLVSELNHRLGVGVEGSDGGSHAAGEGSPGHAGESEGKEKKEWVWAYTVLLAILVSSRWSRLAPLGREHRAWVISAREPECGSGLGG